MSTLAIILHLVSFVTFLGASIYSARQAALYKRGKQELDVLYAEAAKHIQKISHEGNKEVLKWVLRNAETQ